MANEMDRHGVPPPESNTEIIDNELSTCQQLMTRLEELKKLPTTSDTSKEQVWLQFISLWFEVLQLPPSNVESCYTKCVRLFPLLIESTDFHSIIENISVARESCYGCLAQLYQPHLKDYLLLTNEQQNLPNNRIYFGHVDYLLLIVTQAALCIPFNTIDDQQCIDNHVELLTLLIDRVDQSMPKHSPTVIKADYALGTINQHILSLLWNLADRTVLVPILLKCDLGKKIVGWLAQAAMLENRGQRPLISIAYNIARHDDGADELNKHGAIDAIKHYQAM
jgi:hypothetical protein